MIERISNPNEALLRVGKENTELHDELRVVYAQLDGYRVALTTISKMPGPASEVALRALGNRPLNG
jgi:hypothetical protein